ncbi:Rac GTPase-activating protein 1 [Holothuria leucospilota]|uniref:Rac GTPase-activating protein 1 n=1 Tax=Holothuria leucospilota TaxID=206669 RepID=A0A9Q0YP35_HOLLE|nr:Rac GTPase-activating protein 1 [Holothuria leucospilota]
MYPPRNGGSMRSNRYPATGISSMLGPVHTPGKTPKKTPSGSSIGKAKSILTKTSLTPRFGSKSYNSKRKATHFFSSPTLK